MAAAVPPTIRFGPYEADLRSGELRKRGAKVRLRDQCFEVLALLLEHPGAVVTREELRARLWPQDVFVDFDNGLNAAVARIREALGDSAEHPRFIETLPRRGYRFIAPVSAAAAAAGEGAARKVRLAVLPLANLSGDPEQEYFSDGMTEELITQLARMAPDRLGVIARTTSMHYKGTRKDAGRIGRELELDYVVEGSVRRAEDRLRISVQLVQVSDQTHVWASSYDGERRDVLKLQAEVAQAIGRQVEVAVSPAARRRMEQARPVDPGAHDAYVRGLHEFNKTNVSSFQNALAHFRAAVEKDPGYAPAWAKTAITHAFSALWGYASGPEAFPQAEAAAARALQLDEALAEAHMTLGTVAWLHRWDVAACQREYERAVELNPNDPAGHWGLAMFLGSMKEDHQGAAIEIGLARELDPLSTMIESNAGWVHYWAREYDRAVAQSRQVLASDPSCLQAHYVLGLAACGRGSYEEAVAALETSAQRFGDPVSLGWLGMVYGRAGKHEMARAVMRHLQARGVSQHLPSCLAWVHLGLGEQGPALDWLEKARAAHDAQVLWTRVSPLYDPLRDAPRFHRLVDSLGLPPPAPGP